MKTVSLACMCNHLYTKLHAICYFSVPGPVPQPPVVQNDTICSTSALVTWNPPEDPNGIIRNYTVNLMALSSDAGNSQGRGRRKRQSSAVDIECITGSNVEQNITVGGDQTSLRLNNLSEFMYQ